MERKNHKAEIEAMGLDIFIIPLDSGGWFVSAKKKACPKNAVLHTGSGSTEASAIADLYTRIIHGNSDVFKQYGQEV